MTLHIAATRRFRMLELFTSTFPKSVVFTDLSNKLLPTFLFRYSCHNSHTTSFYQIALTIPANVSQEDIKPVLTRPEWRKDGGVSSVDHVAHTVRPGGQIRLAVPFF